MKLILILSISLTCIYSQADNYFINCKDSSNHGIYKGIIELNIKDDEHLFNPEDGSFSHSVILKTDTQGFITNQKGFDLHAGDYEVPLQKGCVGSTYSLTLFGETSISRALDCQHAQLKKIEGGATGSEAFKALMKGRSCHGGAIVAEDKWPDIWGSYLDSRNQPSLFEKAVGGMRDFILGRNK